MVSNVIRDLTSSRNKLIGTRHKALVLNNNDPDKNSKLQVRVRDVHLNVPDTACPWARCSNIDGGVSAVHGHVDLPPIGAEIEVIFEDDSPYHPAWDSAQSTTDTGAENILPNHPNSRGRADYAGHKIYVDQSASGGSITVDTVWGTIITVSATGIVVKVKGTSLIESSGDMSFNSGGNLEMSAHGNLTLRAGGSGEFSSSSNLAVKSGSSLDLSGSSDVSIKAGATASLNGGAAANVFAGGDVTTNGARTLIQGGGGPAGPSSPTSPTAPATLSARERPKIADPSNKTDY